MPISGISNPAAALQAQNAYSTSNSQKASLPTPEMKAETNIKTTETFQTMVNKSFNSFAKMKPDEIISAFAKNSVDSSRASNNGIATKAFESIPKALRRDEHVKRQAIIGEASMTEVIEATSEASTVLKTAVAVRNKVLEAFQRVMDMPI